MTMKFLFTVAAITYPGAVKVHDFCTDSLLTKSPSQNA